MSMSTSHRLPSLQSRSYRAAILTAAAAGLLGLTGSVQAQLVGIANPSFESPGVSPITGVSTEITSWNKLPQPDYFTPVNFPGLTWDSVAGIFGNAPLPSPRHITNADGNQVGYFFAFPGAGISQTLGTSFEAGVAYDLTFGLRGGGSLAAGTQFFAGLQYFNGTDWSSVGATVVSATADYNTRTTLDSITVHTGTVPGGDPSVGKPIRIVLEGSSFSASSGLAYWEVDDLKLNATPVPEPESFAFVAAMGLLGGAVWRRCRRAR